MKVVFADNRIVLKRYPFNNPFWKKRTIFQHEIDFVKLQIDIISICLNSKEIYFIPVDYQEQVMQFIKRHNLQISKKEDVWELICYPYVDTYRTDKELEENLQQLKELSF